MAGGTSVYSQVFGNKVTPQSAPIPGREKEMAQNNAGGYTFTITPFQMLDRFLILGSDSPTYYSTSQKLTKDNAANIRTCLKEDGRRTVDVIVTVSAEARAPKNDAALFALAVAATPAFGSPETAQYALANLKKVARTGTHLMHFVDYLNSMRGWGRSVKRAFSDWYTSKTPDQLAYSLAKYQSRDGWSNKDIAALSHVKASDAVNKSLMAWAVTGGLDALKDAAQNWTRTPKKYRMKEFETVNRRSRYQTAYNNLTGEDAPKIITGYEAAKKATTASEIAGIIRACGLSHEMIPTQFKTESSVWEALLEKMPLMAMVRNLGVMSKVGLLTPLSAAAKTVVSRLSDPDVIRKSKIHPLQILLAQDTYRQGKGFRGTNTWTPVPTVVDALGEAFYSAFANVVPTGKNLYIGLDVSGSMSYSFIAGTQISCAQAGAAMALVIARTEKNYAFYAFSDRMKQIGINASDTLETAFRKTQHINFGGTDCSLPMIHAEKEKMDVDAFIILTDSETWAGRVQPSQALRQYRKSRNKPEASLVVVGMTATKFSIADPKDPYSLDVVGFDSAVPSLISDFIRGSGTGAEELED